MDIVEQLRSHAVTGLYLEILETTAADDIEKLREENAQLRELLQKWLGNCFVDVYGNGVTFGMGVRKVWSETRDALKEEK